MKIGILGTGIVGNTIGSKLTSLGHEVKMGSRSANNEKAQTWVKSAGLKASAGTFADAAAFGDVIFNCTSGGVSIEALKMAGEKNLDGKILVDVANPLDFSKGMPPILIPNLANTNSLGEEIQKTFPNSKVVKTLNTMNCQVMVDATKVPGEHDVFVCGNDVAAKVKVMEILNTFGWKSPIDLGDITMSRGVEMLLPIWVCLYGVLKTPMYNFKIAK